MALATPGSALIRRELLSSLRRPRSFVILALFVGVCIAGIALAWPEGQRQFVSLARLSNELVARMAMLLFLACMIFVPALAAGAIVIEREQETMDLLRVTLLRPLTLLLAKLVSVVGFYLLLLAGSVPVFATVFFLVGLDWGMVLEVVVMLTATAASFASVGLLSSAFSRRITQAVLASYLGVFAILMAGPMAAFFVALVSNLIGRFVPTSFIVGGAKTVGTPYGALVAILHGNATVTQVALAVGLQVVFGLMCLLLAQAALINPPSAPKAEQFKPIDDPRRLRERKLSFPFYLVDPLKRKKPIEDGRNAMFVRELRWGLLDRASTLIRMFYIAFLAYLCIGAMGFVTRGSYLNDRFMVGWLVAQMVGTCLVAPALLANTLTREYESGNIDMLRTTLLTPGDIIRGKVFAGFTAVAPLLLAAVGSCLPLLFWIIDDLGLLLMGYATLFLCAALCLAMGLFASLLTTHTASALVLTYLFTFTALLGTWGFFIVWPLDGYPLLVYLQSPIVFFAENASDLDDRSMFAVRWAGNMAVFGAVTAALVAATLQGFARFRLRDA